MTVNVSRRVVRPSLPIVIASQRVGANAPPDDRLREAIQIGRKASKDWIASELTLLAMTGRVQRQQLHHRHGRA
jgi:hypothetical protein